MEYINSQSLEEIKHHGNIMFPISVYPVEHKIQGHIMSYHWHTELEFIYLSKGEAIFTIDGVNYKLKSGDCLFINSGRIHSGISCTNESFYYSIVFSTSLLTNRFDVSNKFFNNIIAGKCDIIQHFSSKVPSHNEIIEQIKLIINELQDKNFAYELVVKSKLLFVFSILFRNSLYITIIGDKKKQSLDKKYESFRKILSYIEQNSNKKMTLKDISNYMNLTPQYLCTFFKEMANISIIHYINNCRIEQAVSMLKSSKLTITDIALECGFDNISYFNRVFKKLMHCSPSEFREKYY